MTSRLRDGISRLPSVEGETLGPAKNAENAQHTFYGGHAALNKGIP